MPLNESAQGELATDIAAAEALAAIYPDELPDSRDVRDRLATCRKYEERRVAFLTEYAALVLCAEMGVFP